MRVFVIAGEASGDKLGAALMAGLKSLTEVEFSGVGGPLMEAEGLQSLFPMDELSVMGLAEVLPKYPALKRRLNQTVEAALGFAPDILITIDSPDFCLRVARKVKAASAIRTVHYVAPSVWAWRAGRAAKMARVIDHVLALLPFEPPFMTAAGMECDFVGHPVVAEPRPSAQDVAAFRARHGLTDAPLLMVLPGSRRGEVTRLTPIFGEVIARLAHERPDTRLVLPTSRHLAALVREMVADWTIVPLVLAPEDGQTPAEFTAQKACAFHAADWALAASGTVSLELAAARTPMVIAYDMNWLSRTLIWRMLKVDTLTLVNLVSETRAVPEFIGKACRAELIAPELLKLMEDPGAQMAAMETTLERLGMGGEAPGLRAARAVLKRGFT
ncbi:Lipid-A-disaccharide synthase [Roseovarius gaetbuli]|uniref:Lipid-A-disaccharide synthase n=1 Tax=Roseovarius gaetbuli TaxID=1356575 RepID=A0A1X6Y361_9RHOB|nr:lipid-A-disaccharide synthase [Roseovarius gaetbuli]SLN09609.1 Lipid-A-disaccharide synthase [Roseovarius gaetbuli]